MYSRVYSRVCSRVEGQALAFPCKMTWNILWNTLWNTCLNGALKVCSNAFCMRLEFAPLVWNILCKVTLTKDKWKRYPGVCKNTELLHHRVWFREVGTNVWTHLLQVDVAMQTGNKLPTTQDSRPVKKQYNDEHSPTANSHVEHPVPVRSLKSSNIGPGYHLDGQPPTQMLPGAVAEHLCALKWGDRPIH